MKLMNQTKFNSIVKAAINKLHEDLDCCFYTNDVESIETESRPGYSPYSHNQGGYTLKAFTDLRSMWGSGDHHNTYAASFIDYLIDRDRRCFMDYNKLTEADMEPESKHDDDWIEGLGDDSNSLYLEVMMMFTDKDSRGVYTLSVNAYLEGSDAPYHRGYDFKYEKDIRFKTASGLNRQLKALMPKLRKFCFVDSSKQGEFESTETRSIYQYSIRKPMSEIEKGA